MGGEKEGFTAASDPPLLHDGETVATLTETGKSRKRADFGKEKPNRKTGGSLPTIHSQVSLKGLE